MAAFLKRDHSGNSRESLLEIRKIRVKENSYEVIPKSRALT